MIDADRSMIGADTMKNRPEFGLLAGLALWGFALHLLGIDRDEVAPYALALITSVVALQLFKARQGAWLAFKNHWTLADPVVWEETHRLGGSLLLVLALGILLTASTHLWKITAIVGIALVVVITTRYARGIAHRVD